MLEFQVRGLYTTIFLHPPPPPTPCTPLGTAPLKKNTASLGEADVNILRK